MIPTTPQPHRLLVPRRGFGYRVSPSKREPIDFLARSRIGWRRPREWWLGTRTVTTTLPGCCCPMVDCDCPCCPTGYWSQFTFPITGIVNNPPPDCFCANYNGSFTANYIGACVYTTGDIIAGGCSGDPDGWALRCGGGDIWTLGNAFMGVVYVSDPTPDFCTFGGVLLGGPTGVACQNFAGPFTITVSPGGVWVPC